MSISEIRRFASDLQTNVALCAEVDELDRVTGAAPASIDPSIASLLEPWGLP
jgi:hypothetical protein